MILKNFIEKRNNNFLWFPRENKIYMDS